MSDLIEDPETGNAPEFTVAELSGAIKRTIEGAFQRVRVRGEVGRVSLPRSGHMYLDLKDDRAVLASVIWKGVAGRLTTRPEEGMEVIATGRLTTFPGQSRYQLVIEELRPAGIGALMAMLEKRKAALAAEGLFDPGRKRALPYLPRVIGVVTSPSGAVIRDILHRISDRFPTKVLIWPVAVQGEKCAPEVVRAIEGFNALTPGGALPRPDVLIVARGGGSVEDLWGFNEEIVVRAAAASSIPLISAVGHETDTTLIDFASDQRAPTPTAAAEFAVPVRAELLATLGALDERLRRGAVNGLALRQQRMRDLARALPRVQDLLSTPSQRLDHLGERLPNALRHGLQQRRIRLMEVVGRLRPGAAVAQAQSRLAGLAARLPAALDIRVGRASGALSAISRALSPRVLARMTADGSRRLDQAGRRFEITASRRTEALRQRLDALDRLRQTLGYKATLARGYAVVRSADAILTGKAQAAAAGVIEIEFHDGRLKVRGGATSNPPAKAASKPKPGDGSQGSLF